MFYKIIYVVEINSERMHLHANMYENVCVWFGMDDAMYVPKVKYILIWACIFFYVFVVRGV